jgi:hypothetical protein
MLAHIMGIPVEENVLMLAGGVGAGTTLAVVFRTRVARFANRIRTRRWR